MTARLAFDSPRGIFTALPVSPVRRTRGDTSNPFGGATAPTIKPIITVLTSLPPATASTPVVITVVGGSGVPIRRAWIDAVLPGIVGSEVIHNGDRFGSFYVNPTNTRASILNGYQYTILRDGGWPAGSFPLLTSFEVSAVDTVGNGT